MKQLFFISVLLGLGIPAIAQSEYKEGFVITHDGDTVKGFIDVSQFFSMCHEA
ncbi:MAG: hypothetical protein U5K79_21050 [Cyclobacteriaceae bacterium]|nr:hypothetical protein [Cyclobacteriaceae bacterium]